MKIVVALIAAALLCGCQKSSSPSESKVQRWEYKVVTIENFAHRMEHSAFEEMSTNTDAGLSHSKSAKSDSGSFLFDGAKGGDEYAADLYYLGNDGWELVSAIPQMETVPDAEKYHGQDFDSATSSLKDGYTHFNNIRTGKVTLIFKRPQK